MSIALSYAQMIAFQINTTIMALEHVEPQNKVHRLLQQDLKNP
jgi:hypothetical protein